MSDNQKLLLILIGAYVLLKKTGVRPVGGYRAPPVDNTKNMQNAMWAALLGDVWHGVMDSARTSGGRPIVGENGFGQIVTGDGRPVDDTEFAGIGGYGDADYSDWS